MPSRARQVLRMREAGPMADGREKWKELPRGVQREEPYASDSANPHCSTSQVSKTSPNGFMCQMLILKR